MFHRLNGERVVYSIFLRVLLISEPEQRHFKIQKVSLLISYKFNRHMEPSNPSPHYYHYTPTNHSVGHGYAFQRSALPTRKSSSKIDETFDPSPDLARGSTSVSIPSPNLSLVFFKWENRTLSAAQTVIEGRHATENILKGNDDRLMVVVGCVPILIPIH